MTEVATRLRYINLWERSGAKGNPMPHFQNLCRRYTEPHRAYHTLQHINHCLNEFEAVRNWAADPLSVEWALWYHDIIYQTGATDNEKQSAKLVRTVLLAAKIDNIVAHLAAAHIMGTAHADVPASNDSQLVADIDLAILGQSAEAYLEYQRQVTAEYVKLGGVELDRFLQGRANLFLRPFLKRRRIYATDHFRNLYETRARYNLATELVRLNNHSWRQTVKAWVQ